VTGDGMYDWNDRFKRSRPEPALQPVNGHANGHTSAYGAKALAGEVETMQATGEGSRNHQLNTSAFKLGGLVGGGELAEADAAEQLKSAAMSVGLDSMEVFKTFRSGIEAGKQNPRQAPPRPLTAPVIDPASLVAPSEATGGSLSDEQAEQVRTTWWPEPIAHRAVQAAEAPSPTHLYRDDDCALFYSAKVNGLIGESESGKSWVALLAVVQAVAAGQQVLILDFEDSPAAIHRRLDSLGVTVERLGLIHYADPSESLGVAQSADLREALALQYQLIVADGVNAAMTLLGYDLNSNTDATLFATRLLRPLARTGACVVTVDHVPKNPDARGKGGIGAQAKRSMMDGTCLLVEVVEPFGKGQSGTLRLTVDKDRNGAVRGICGGGRHAGKAHLESGGEQVRLHIEAPDRRPSSDREPWRPTAVMEKVSRLLEDAVQPLSGREITDAVSGKGQTIRQAITELIAGGYLSVARRSGRGGGDVYSSVKEFRDLSREVRPSASEVRPGRGYESASRPLSPYGEGTHFDGASDTPQNGSASRTHLPDKQPGLDMPEGQSSCNHCGQATPDDVLANTAGYCRPCARLWSGQP
jgi:KaiC/GvpD/RAD55 family RecA-like ATPase